MNIINVCAKLHNICIEKAHVNQTLETMADEYERFVLQNLFVRESGIFGVTVSPSFEDGANDQPDDEEVITVAPMF